MVRSDAARNRQRVIDAATEILIATGREPVAAEVTKRAGVGPGTLFRHFPTMRDLLAEVYRSELANIAVLADDATRSASSDATALCDLVRVASRAYERKRLMLGALELAGLDARSTAGDSGAIFRAAISDLLAGASAAGDIEPTWTVDMVIALIAATAQAAQTPGLDSDSRRRVTEGIVAVLLR